MRYLLTVVISLILSVVCYVQTSFADVSYADMFMNERGYKPVEDSWYDKSQIIHYITGSPIPDSSLYREWCINTFKNGDQIYEAYKEIAFGIDYRAEPPKTDYWQTPIETRQIRHGDCEDSIFLFFSRLSELDIDGDIMWGWVVDRSSSVSFAHVWYQIFDKHGKPYIVEGFSKEWNGIIPVEIVNEREERIPTLMLRHNQINHVIDEMTPKFTDLPEDEQFPLGIFLNNTTLIKDILQKLQDMFIRYRKEMRQLS